MYSSPNFERAILPERGPASAAAHDMAEDAPPVKIPVLGKTLLFRGELTAEEDVILQGRVEGSIRHARSLVIGTEGSVLGDVYANHLTVEGLVEGDLHGVEAVIVRATAQVRGNIFAPRVGIMEGATFNGRVEMDAGTAAQTSQQGGSRQGTRQPAAPQRSGGAPAASAPGRAGAAPASSAARSNPASAGSGAAASGAAHGAATGSTLSDAVVDQMLSAQTSNRK